MTMDELRPTTGQLEDLFWRALWTFLQAFIGVLLGAQFFDWSVDTLEVAGAAGIGAVLSVMKTFASQRLGRGTS